MSKMEHFPKITFKPLTIFAKNSVVDVWLGSEYAFNFLYYLYLNLVPWWKLSMWPNIATLRRDYIPFCFIFIFYKDLDVEKLKTIT